jgi:hypothetical protein
MAFNLMNGAGLGAGVDFLQQVLTRKAVEAFEQQRLEHDAARIRQQAAQADAQNAIAQGHLQLGQQQLGEHTREFDAGAPLRDANLAHVGAETASLTRAPEEAEKQRALQQALAEGQRTFTAGQGDLNRQNAVRIAGINGQNTLAAVRERAKLAGGGQAPAAAPQQQNEVADAIQLIDQISSDSALNPSVGPLDQYGLGKAQDLNGVNRFEALHNQLVGKLALAQAGKLKGQGQISDKERALLAAAATALNRGLSEKDYRTELGKIRQQFERMQQGGAVVGGAAPVPAATSGATQEYDYVPGKGLVPRGGQ